ncbi:hypothetical protein V8B55DRAFT_1468748 [Mucor lusitanicus]|uniref:Galactose oxidase n=1 Tax=Mucor circinelloides f. lusitanicus TaxID=29924 RepID=A0A8H4B676_MUCCL|nr:hypothetical protein FB192DRAFT_1045960 [Mucor lusitanicus]KAF1807800.1 hypothetical protein FB192DRAFT_1357485 [Mucor lusitanicus]
MKETIFLVLALVSSIQSIVIAPRRAANCAYLSNKIYCYGGYVKGSTDNDTLTVLDINSNNGSSFQNLINKWEPVAFQSANSFGFRAFAQAVPFPDGKRLLLQGGYNYESTPLLDHSIVYNAETNSWDKLPNYYDANNGGDRQIYYGTGVFIPELNSIGFYGGYQEHVQPGSNFVALGGTSVPNLTFNNSDGLYNSYAGFYYFTLLNLNTNTWSIPQQSIGPADYHTSPTATYHPTTKKIFYLGGTYYNSTSQSLFNSYFTYAMTFDTTNGLWSYEPLSGPDYPKERKMHTATLLSDGQNILMYGGTYDDKVAVQDYCYTLNVPKMTWRMHTLAAPLGVSGPRSHHSAVLVNDTSLFIMFGLDKDGNPTNDLMILDVADVNAISFLSTFPKINNSSTSNTNGTLSNGNRDSNASNQGGGGLSTGVIVGIAVGCGVAGILAIIALIFFCRKRSKNNTQSSHNHAEEDTNESPMLDVDWDRIDKQYYQEISPPNEHQHVQQRNSTTIEERLSEPSTTATTASVVTPDGTSTSRTSHIKLMQVVKPDGGR